jgi:hypothetical protein
LKIVEEGWKSVRGIKYQNHGSNHERRIKILTVGVRRVPLLTGSVTDQVSGPSEQLLDYQVSQDDDRSIANSVLQFLLPLLADGNTLVLSLLLDLGNSQLGPGSGNKDLIPGDVTGSGVVTTVRDPPRVVRDQEGRVQDPSYRVVDGLGLGEGLVTTLVSDDPETGTEETEEEGDGGVSGGTGELVSNGGQVAAVRRNKMSATSQVWKGHRTTYKEDKRGSTWKEAQAKAPIAIKSCPMYWEDLIADRW